MKTETEIRRKLKELVDEMTAIKADSESDLYGQPKKDNPMIRAGMIRDSLRLLDEVAILFWVLDEKIPKTVFDLTPSPTPH